MPRGEPKVMFAVRLPGPLRERIAEQAQEEAVTEAELTERAFSLFFEQQESRSYGQ